jgi:hypothetical protein
VTRPGRRRAPRLARRPAPRLTPPRWLDPVLAFAERVDRRRRDPRPIRVDGVLAIELVRHGAAAVLLGDGTVVARGDPVGIVHFRNERVRAAATSGWQLELQRLAAEDLRAFAAWWRSRPPAERPVALRATTILGALARRDGWEIRPRPRSYRARLDDWYMTWLLGYWSRDGRARIAGRSDRRAGRLVSVDAWLSCSRLQERYPA